MLNNKSFQQKLAQKAALILAEQIESEVAVGNATFTLFNSITLHDVLITDRQNDTLLVADELDAKFFPLRFLKGEFVFQNIKIRDVLLNLKNDAQQGNNFDFILDALKTDKPSKNKDVFYQIKAIRLYNCNVKYSSNKKPPLESDMFDVNNIDIEGLNVRLSLNHFTNDSLALQLFNLNFKDKSGFEVKNISALVEANQKDLNIHNFNIQLANTDLKTSSLYFEYDELKNLDNFMDRVLFKIDILPSKICLGDFAAFVPAFETINEAFNISGTITGPVSNMVSPNLTVTYGTETILKGNFEVLGLPDINNTFVFAQVSDLNCTKSDIETFINDIKDAPFTLPSQFQSVEELNFKGELKGYLMKNLVALGNIETNLGNIYTNFSLVTDVDQKSYTYGGEIKTHKFRLGSLLANNELGNISLNLKVSGEKKDHYPAFYDISGVVSEFSYNNYNYSNITLNGLYNDSRFNGIINLDDENGKIQVNGLLDFSEEMPYYDFTAKVINFQPNKMNLIQKYPDLVLSFNINTNVRGSRLDNMTGNVFADNILLTNGDKQLFMQELEVMSEISDSISSIIISSDFINGVVEGKYTMSTFVSSARYVASQYIPALNSTGIQLGNTTDNNFDFDVRVNDLDTISSLFNFKWHTSADISIFGFYDDQTRKFRLRGVVPELEYNNKTFLSDVTFSADNPQDNMRLALDMKMARDNSPAEFDIFFRAFANNDSLTTVLQWSNNQEKMYAGDLSTVTQFSRNEDNKLVTGTDMMPTRIILADTLWNVQESNITTAPEKVTIQNFGLSNNKQNIQIDGVISKNDDDVLDVLLKNVNLGHLEQLVNLDILSLDGYVTGNAKVSSVLKSPIFQANLNVKDFAFNKSRWGDLVLLSTWDSAEERLRMDIDVTDENKQIIDLSGYVYPTRNIELDLDIKATDLKIDFLQPFLAGALQNISGTATSKNLRMIGPLVKPLFVGDAYVANAGFDIDFLKTHYSFSDTVHITRNTYSFNDVTIYDTERNSGKVSGNIQHNSYQNFLYRINGQFNNIIGLNTQMKDNEDFYGKVYGTGNLHIRGDSKTLNIDIGMKTDPNTKLTIPFSSYLSASDNSFITFIDPTPIVEKKETSYERRRRQRAANTSKTMIKMTLQIDATPDGEIQLIIDPDAGDMIRATGSGSLRLEYDELAGIKMYGNYVLNKGYYNFTLQNVIRKDFTIKQGSSITWTGLPYAPDINIDAYYSVTPTLTDLFDEATLSQMSINRSSIPVNCLLKLTGELTKPNIKFDLEIPGNNPEVERMIRNVINSDEMMNRQMIFLLAIGRFYRPDYMRNDQTTSNELSSLVSSTLSSQLNHWLSQINDNLSMEVNYRSATEGDNTTTEVDIGVGYGMFNERLIFTGNIGYRDDVLSTTNFIGDFDLEYKLTKSGKLRAKAYSHSNDKYYLKNTTTQGAGLIYREEFDNFGDLFSGYWNKWFKKKEDDVKIIPQPEVKQTEDLQPEAEENTENDVTN